MADFDPFETARARNRAMVREQRRALGMDRDEESPGDVGKLVGVARLVVPMNGEAVEYNNKGPADPRVKAALKQLRRDVQSVPGRVLDSDECVRLHNGDFELRAWWSQRMTRQEADEAMAKQAALRGETH